MTSANRNIHYGALPADAAFFHQVVYGLSAVLACLRARIHYRPLLLPLLYVNGAPTPKAYSETEIESLGLDR